MLLSTCIAIISADCRRLARYAERRERFLSALDWTLLTDEFARVTSMDDEWVDAELAEADMYLDHLENKLCDQGDMETEMMARFVIPPHLLIAYATA